MFFTKKTPEQEQQQQNETEQITEQIIESLKSTEDQQNEQETKPQIKFKIDTPKKPEQPTGSIFIKISINDNIEFASFTIYPDPDIYQEAISMIKELLSKIENPSIKINSNCNCGWCKLKLKELYELLNQ